MNVTKVVERIGKGLYASIVIVGRIPKWGWMKTRKRLWKNCGQWRNSTHPQALPSIKECNWQHYSCNRWKYFGISCEVKSIYETKVQLGFNIKTSSISVVEKENSPPLAIFDDNIFEVVEHNVNYKKQTTKLAS